MKFNKLAAVAAIIALTGAAHATVFGNTDNSTHNTPVALGGSANAGAAAGAVAGAAAIAGGGSATSTANGGKGGTAAVVGSGNSSNRNSVRSSNTVRSTNTATTGPSSANSTSGGNTLRAGDVSTGAVLVDAADRSATVVAAQERAPVNTAYAPSLSAAPETCMGSSSGGAQGASFGVSFGTTWTSEGCEARMDARALREAGMPTAALARLCQREATKQAIEATGQKCPNVQRTADASPVMMPTTTAQTAPAQGEPLDPFVRSRLGLPPLK